MGSFQEATGAFDPPAPGRRPLLTLSDLRVVFTARGKRTVAVNGVTIEVGQGEAVGIVGESGSGKSTLARAIVGLLDPNGSSIEAGVIQFGDRTLLPHQWRSLRGGDIAMVFQDPLSYLNPVMTIGKQIAESVRRHDRDADVDRRVDEILEMVSLSATMKSAYPHELSGGMRQRVLIGIAIGCKPKLLIADEPTTALDVSTQSEILDLISSLRRDLGMALILITHDLGAVATTTERLNVMLLGKIVESGRTETILNSPEHEYTSGLLRSARAERDANGRFITMDVVRAE